jgi:hypothetical protein
LNEWHLGLRKPGTGLPAELLDQLIGRRLVRAVACGQFLTEDDFAAPMVRELQGHS